VLKPAAPSTACKDVIECTQVGGKCDLEPEPDEELLKLAEFAYSRTGRDLSRSIGASVMVPFVALCNHSCIPNVEVDFLHEGDHAGFWCKMTATRNSSR